jgi:hypothetical protein
MGSPALAGWIAHAAFWGLLVWGLALGELSIRLGTLFLLLWIGGRVGLPYLPYGAGFFSPYLAMLDIALVFLLFKGDVRLT